MESRDESIVEIRPSIGEFISCDNQFEHFQTFTLRPILKFQNPLLLLFFKEYLQCNKKQLSNLTFTAQKSLVKDCIQNDVIFKNSIIHLVVALFSNSELKFYLSHKKEINKRICQLMQKRIQDQVELL